MDSNRDASLYYPVSNAYDTCLVSSFLKNMFKHCREKKATPGLTIEKSVVEVRASLEKLNDEQPIELSYDYLSAMEASLPDVSFRYAVINKDGVPVLFAYFQLFTLSGQNFNLEKNTKFIRGILGFFLKLKKAKVLMLGSAIRTETVSYCYNEQLITREEAIAAIAGIAEELASSEHATAVILKDLDSTTLREQRTLKKMGYQIPWSDQVMEMDIDDSWKTLKDYTAALTRKYKTRAGKILANSKDLHIKILTGHEVEYHQQAIKELFDGLVEKQSFTLTNGGVNNISGLKKLYKDDFDVVGFFHEDRLVAFYSAFHRGSSYELYYAGFNYELNARYQLYFNILFSGLERAILLQKKQLKLGRTSFDAKASIGARPRDTDYLIKMAHIPDVVVKWFASYFSSLEDAQWKLRNPLKTATQS